MDTAPRASATPSTSAGEVPPGGHLPGDPPRLLTLTEVAVLFCDRLRISRSSYKESVRPWLPVLHVRVVPVRGQRGRYRPGSPRVREDVARELVGLAAEGQWREYCAGELAETHPHFYRRS